jgi:hypothetical protein
VSTKEQLSQAKLLMGLYKTAVEAITTKQEGERRAHGFDYKIQQEVGSVDKQKAERDARLAIECDQPPIGGPGGMLVDCGLLDGLGGWRSGLGLRSRP